jgi:hypothetical protein
VQEDWSLSQSKQLAYPEILALPCVFCDKPTSGEMLEPASTVQLQLEPFIFISEGIIHLTASSTAHD